MHDNTHEKPDRNGKGEGPVPVHPLKTLSRAEFAALGAHSVVYARQIDAADLRTMLPQTDVDPEAGALQLVMSADGTPVLITDSPEAIDVWLSDQPVELATVH